MTKAPSPRNHPALKELYDIIKEEDWSSFCPEKTRHLHLDEWVDRWVVNVEFSQPVVNTSMLTSEYNDVIKLKLSQCMAEDVAETCAIFNTTSKSIDASMCAFRRKSKT